MKKIVLFFVVLFTAVLFSACRAFGDSATRASDLPSRDVLAHASADTLWFAKVVKLPQFMLQENSPTEQTEVFARQNGPGQTWHALPPLPGRVVSLATRSSQLAVLMSDGQWSTLSSDGSPTGQQLPAGGRLLTLGDDGSDLWAIGAVDGGIAAADDALAIEQAATRPTTLPYLSQSRATPARSGGTRLVIFHQQNGRWATVTEWPAQVTLPTDTDLLMRQLSLVVIAGRPIVACKTSKGEVQILRYDASEGATNGASNGTDPKMHGWRVLATPAQAELARVAATQSVSSQPTGNRMIAGYCLFSDGYDPYFWQTTGNCAGEMIVNVSDKSVLTPLQWTGDPLDGLPTATFSGGFVCVIGPHAGKVLEQRYQRDGTAFETAGELSVPTDNGDRPFFMWLEIAFLSMMGFSVGASVFQQWNQPEKAPVVETVIPAELFPRFAAGMIDLLPVIAAVAVLLTVTNAADDLAQMPSLKGIAIMAVGVIVYLLHTTLTEVRIGRTVGKWLLGLRVVTVDGKTPTQSQLMTRNLLRVVDPLVMILVSPLRQRSADTVAGTVVIEEDAQAEANPLSEEPDGE
jgi:uncharacterized RDD family membrane protein YckC